MKNQSGFKTVAVFKRIFNFRAWADWDRTRAATLYLVRSFKKFFVPQETEVVETFEAAQKRQNLSDYDLKKRQTGLWRLSVLMLIVAAFLFCYTLYHIYFLHIRAAILSVIVMLIALVLAFRYHFWYFQIRERKLGCTIREWYRRGLMGRSE